ncbi:MAG TPA: amidohydrolase family protein, partial [Sandaracinaceae bacterium]
DRVARRVHELARWHVELYADAKDLAPVFDTLARLPAVSIAHLGLSQEGLPTLLKLVERGMKVKATGFGRIEMAPGPAIEAIVKANPDALMFGTDLPSQRARRPFEPADIDLIRAHIDPPLERKVFFENAVSFYRPRQAPAAG